MDNMRLLESRFASCLIVALVLPCACGKAAEGQAPVAPPAPAAAAAAPEAKPTVSAPRQSSAKALNAGECPASALIDDGEDGDGRVLSADRRGGYWYTYADQLGTTISPTGTFKMTEGGAEGSKYSARMSGKVTTGGILYAGMGFTFTEPKAAYDVSCCKGVSFWAKKNVASTGSVRVKLGDANTTPDGGACHDCYNDFGAEVTLSDAWKKYELPFSELKQEFGWGEPRPALDTGRVYQLQWQVRDPGVDFDVSVDRVELLGCRK